MHLTRSKTGPALRWISLVTMCAAGHAFASTPPAPTLLSPANSASVQSPFTISWSAVSDPSGILAYNWQVSATSNFSSYLLNNSTMGPTQDTVSGLPPGTYFWHVQAVDNAFVQSAWSQPFKVTITGAGSGSLPAPVMGPPKGYSTFHPFEAMTFNWSVVPGAATYTVEFATDSTFPVLTSGKFDNLPTPTMTFELADNEQGNYFIRALAVDAHGVASLPSNVVQFSVSFNNPLPAPPSPISPLSGQMSLPVTLKWTDVPNPQDVGYEVQIAKDSGFSTIEEDDPQITEPMRTVLSLTPGTKFWRVRSAQGDNSPNTAAETAWSTSGSFTIPSTPPVPVSVSFTSNPLHSGNQTFVQVQLNAAVGASGATIQMSSSNPAAAPVPATVTMPPNTGWTQFQITAGQVAADAPVSLTATLNGGSAIGALDVQPAVLQSLHLPNTNSGGTAAQLIVLLNGVAPTGGAAVSLSSNSPAATPPSVVVVPEGSPSAVLAVPTSEVTAATTATITGSWNGTTASSTMTITPQSQPQSLTLNPSTVTGQAGSVGTVTVAVAPTTDETLQVTSSNPAVASVPSTVTIPQGSTRGGFNILTQPVTAATVVTITVSGGGTPVEANLTLLPATNVSVSSVTVSPLSVTGGAAAQGTVTLNGAAPSGGLLVALSSNSVSATVPASLTVAQGATSGTFAISTTSVPTSTTATIVASAGGVSQSGALTITPPAQNATLTVTATGRSGETVSSAPAGIKVATGSSQSASFPVGQSITFSITDGRDAIWSGACSSGGNKTKTCTFTLTANGTVSVNVQ